MAAIHFVYTAACIATQFGEDEDFLHDISIGMEPEDGCLHVINSTEENEHVFASTEFGIENLRELILIHKSNVALGVEEPFDKTQGGS